MFGIFKVCTDVYACHCTEGCTNTVRESALKIVGKDPLLHHGIEPRSVLYQAFWSPTAPVSYPAAVRVAYSCHVGISSLHPLPVPTDVWCLLCNWSSWRRNKVCTVRAGSSGCLFVKQPCVLLYLFVLSICSTSLCFECIGLFFFFFFFSDHQFC